MLTGMIPMTSGDCVVYGNNASHDMNKIRRDIGLCPQHNILWDHLTVREHLDFYGALKGLSKAQRNTSIDYFIRGVDLEEQAEMLAGNLSGGQKRKLSVAIAFIGLGHVVILDEPTAGMDVQARRSTWELIRDLTPGRTIILTTHFMDEADILGKTVAIMSKGRLHCSGSPLFLKSRLGVGYTMHVGIKEGTDIAPLTTSVKSHIHDAQLLAQTSASASYRLPMGTQHHFPNLFRWMEGRDGVAHGVESFGVNVTTLEEVFIRIAMNEDPTALLQQQATSVSSTPSENAVIEMEPRNNDRNTTAVEIRPEDHEAVQIYSVFDHPEDLAESKKNNFARQFAALLLKRMHNARRDRRAQMYQIALPIFFVLLALLLGEIGPPGEPRLKIDPGMYDRDQFIDAPNCPFNLTQNIRSGYIRENRFNSTGKWSKDFAQYLLDTHDSRDAKDERFISIFCNDPKMTGTTLFMNASAVHSAPEVIQAHDEAWARGMLGRSVTFQLYVNPLAWTQRQSLLISTLQAFISAVFVMIPFCFIPSIYTSWLVKERETKAKHLQIVSGLNTYAFWLSNLLWDMTSFLVTEFLAIMVFAMFNRTEYISGDAFGATFLAMFLYGLSAIGFAYVASFFFKSHSGAQNAVMMFNFMCGFAFVITIQILGFIDSTESVADGLRWFFRISPAYCLGESLIYIATAPTLQDLGELDGIMNWDPIGPPLLFMAIEFPIFFGLAMILDSPKWLASQQSFLGYDTDIDGDYKDTSNEDVDVARERKEVMEGRTDDLVTVKNFRKVFPTSTLPKVAVRYLSFGIKKAEIFGFLGTNGAGKTTTLSMLSGEFPPTSGEGKLFGYDVVHETVEARRHLGYCPQFDALIDLMTPREHLNLYSALRGVPVNKVSPSVEALLRAACLEEYADQPVKGLSGGNKRKLSLALALIGGPHVVFLDEPSAGMDPVARRSLWGTIQGMAKGRSVVLTTHHLEEVEALSHRVAIMDHGELKCIGSLPHLRHKFGDGYEMLIKAKDMDSVATTRQFIEGSFAGVVLEEVHGERMTYQLPQEGTALTGTTTASVMFCGTPSWSCCRSMCSTIWSRSSGTPSRRPTRPRSRRCASRRAPCG